jgi:hypothetical protein
MKPYGTDSQSLGEKYEKPDSKQQRCSNQKMVFCTCVLKTDVEVAVKLSKVGYVKLYSQ